ncbi:hypothetical protein CBM2615_A10059 [Cupriavidus taiwanensis]|uniref:Uncharacterized protein n=1 Tax=Cupriavidus taiwanensis TaxID=164546 RepID=A0A375DYT7_9BURK|nr:hypothetical protein CBM2614_A10060 [Cupriavidus taiwanensis]SOZ48796.1 hypothetical protein CBM2615_A10059 [Cupriavidus taiwanensis]SOZ51623.1 hypothetical protein CBM2613_A10059 [Cupriavidus taiwanensis]SPA03999.1 hypothetical protein CBM2625_A10058 [Cupriavidus taiwanensis]
MQYCDIGEAPQLYRNVNSLGMRIVQEIRGIFGKTLRLILGLAFKVSAMADTTRDLSSPGTVAGYAGAWLSKPSS